MCCCNKDERTQTHAKFVMLMVFRGLKRKSDGVEVCEGPGIWMTLSYVAFTDSESTIGWKEVGRVGEETNTTHSIRVVESDPRVLQESRQMEVDFVNQLDVHRKRQRQWASGILLIPTKNGGGAEQLEYRSKLCEKELKRSSSDVECAMLGASPRKIRSLDASRARRMVGTASKVAIEPQPDEEVVCQDLTGEMSTSLSEIRKETHRWKTKWRHAFVNHKRKSSTVVCCHERELCGFVHGDDFIITGDSVQLMWIESRLKEGLNFERCAHLGVDDGADKTVTNLNRLVTCVCLSGSRNQAAVRAAKRTDLAANRPMLWLRDTSAF